MWRFRSGSVKWPREPSSLSEGQVVERESFEPDRSFVGAELPSVRAPEEARFCLARLAAIAVAAGR